MAAHGQGYRTRRVDAPVEPMLAGTSYDYADAFELALDRPDAHSAEEWVRHGLEGSPAPVRGLIRFVHARLIRFALCDGPEAVLGWRVVRSEPDVIHLHAEGPLLGADIVARRTSPTTFGFRTFVGYRHPAARSVWRVVGPLHRAIAPYLLRRAAATI